MVAIAIMTGFSWPPLQIYDHTFACENKHAHTHTLQIPN